MRATSSPPSEQLRTLGRSRLIELLERRPDVLLGPAPRSLAEVAQRLDHPASIRAAVDRLTSPLLSVACVVSALGENADVQQTAELLGGDPTPFLHELSELWLVDLEPNGAVRASPGLRDLLRDPLGWGPPFRELAATMTVEGLRRVQKALGLERATTKPATIDSIETFYTDGAAVRQAVAALGSAAGQELTELAAPGEADGYDDYDVEDWDRRYSLEQLGVSIGLLLPFGFGRSAVMPAEVVRALRGPDYQIRFDPEPPQLSTSPVADLARDAAAAATSFDEIAAGLLDRLVQHPVPVLKSGGVGARELVRLAKTLGADVETIRLALELLNAAGLLDPDAVVAGKAVVGPSAQAVSWRAQDPADRYVTLVMAWWTLAGQPSESTDENGGTRRALALQPCESCLVARTTWLRVLPDAATELDGVAQLAAWHRPTAHFSSLVAQDAAALGLLARGARTPLGTALVTGDPAVVRDAVADALPATNDRAVFGTDLTAFVTGSPSARVSGLLDSVADRESRGGAVTWRFSPASVRRALDAGGTADEVAQELAGVAGGALPNALSVLLADVGRLHGRVRVAPAAAVLVSEDVALLAQIARDRKLSKFELRQVAPTVLVGSVAPAALVDALRNAGYLPVLDQAGAQTVKLRSGQGADRGSAKGTGRGTAAGTGTDQVGRVVGRIGGAPGAERRADQDGPRRAPRRVAVDGLVDRLLGNQVAARSRSEEQLAELTGVLTDTEIHILADALDRKGQVEIVYQSGSGGLTSRVIEPELLAGPNLWAYCRLREDDRVFTVGRIHSVSPA